MLWVKFPVTSFGMVSISPTDGRREKMRSLPHSLRTYRRAAELVSKSAGQANAMSPSACNRSVRSYEIYSTKFGYRAQGRQFRVQARCQEEGIHAGCGPVSRQDLATQSAALLYCRYLLWSRFPEVLTQGCLCGQWRFKGVGPFV